MSYRTLVLGRGLHEDSALTYLVAQCEEELATQTPEELLQLFADSVKHIAMVDRVGEPFEGCYQAEKQYDCFICSAVLIEGSRFCHMCGARRKDLHPITQEDINADAAALFRDWFTQEVNEFSDYTRMLDLGWDLCSPALEGGFVRAPGFDRFLADGDMGAMLREIDTGVITSTVGAV